MLGDDDDSAEVKSNKRDSDFPNSSWLAAYVAGFLDRLKDFQVN